MFTDGFHVGSERCLTTSEGREGDGTHTVDATVTVTVTDVPEAPSFSSLPSGGDWFPFMLQGGRTYRFDYWRRSTEDETLAGPELIVVTESSTGRRLLRVAPDDDGGTEFVAPRDGRYEVWLVGSERGSYSLVVGTVPAPVFGETSYTFALAENADGSEGGISLGAVQATDPNGDALR